MVFPLPNKVRDCHLHVLPPHYCTTGKYENNNQIKKNSLDLKTKLTSSFGMHNTFRNSLSVKMSHLIRVDKVLKNDWSNLINAWNA